MAEAPVEASLNEGALKRFDPYIKEIIDTAKYVALYSFVDNVWTKTKVEGSLFVYARTAEPYYNILVLNRLDNKNLVQPITPKLDLQKSEPYLLYRNCEGSIFGIWFFDGADCLRLTNLIYKLMDKSASGSEPQVVVSGSKQNVDIFKMLTKAQEAFSAKEGRPIPPRQQSPRHVEGTPSSVAEFFAKAGSAPTESSILPRSKKISESDQNTVFLQRLMSNPAHSVEHIEKQQRVVTPLSAEPDSQKKVIRPQSSGFEFLQSSVVDPTLRSIPTGNGIGIKSNNVMYCTANEDVKLESVIKTNGLSTPNRAVASPGGLTDEDKKPDLMPPAMFTPRDPYNSVASRDTSLIPEPLTRNQLHIALDYLLRNDPEFMVKLHEAYIKSLTSKII